MRNSALIILGRKTRKGEKIADPEGIIIRQNPRERGFG